MQRKEESEADMSNISAEEKPNQISDVVSSPVTYKPSKSMVGEPNESNPKKLIMAPTGDGDIDAFSPSPADANVRTAESNA